MNRVINANVKVHEALLKNGDYEKSPHRLKENVDRVCKKIEAYISGTLVENHLDIGCGDGFMYETFQKANYQYGVDVSLGMLNKAQEKFPTVKFKQASVYELPFPDGFFDFITCYSFLDHLEDRRKCYSEVFRVLKPNGKIFFGLSPNKRFINAFNDSEYCQVGELQPADVYEREKLKAVNNGLHYLERYGIEPEDLVLCEPGKTIEGGMDPLQECKSLKELGFSNTQFKMDWIFGQTLLSDSVIEVIGSALPFSIPLYKYFDLYGEKL